MQKTNRDVAVIGGGPAGMISAIMAARNGCRVILFEKNEKLGKKLYITGKGRCNLCNASDIENILNNIVHNNKFLYSALYGFDSSHLIGFFEEIGLKIKIERGNRAFPYSDRSSDVIKCLERELHRQGVEIRFNTKVKGLFIDQSKIVGVETEDERFGCHNVIIATGGQSYPLTGSTGDGYRFAEEVGHKISKQAPGLVPIMTEEPWVTDLQGLSLKNVQIKIIQENARKGKVLYEEFGEMLFTHYGLSGPLILSGSSYLPKEKVKGIKILIDLKPSLTYEQLDARLLHDFEKYNRKKFENSLEDLFPRKLIPTMVSLSEIDPEKKVDQITKEERKRFSYLIKGLECTILDRRPFSEAIITRGGVEVKGIHPHSMESKHVNGLYFAGEVIDVDALTGGYNLQIAFSTGYAAGQAIQR